jgi:AraC-like DNA-binding protein
MTTLPWPATTPPRLKLAGQFPLADRAFSTTYQGPAHALHLHGYSGRMRLAGGLVELRPGDITLSPAGRPSSYDLPAPGTHWCVHFEPTAPAEDAVTLPLHLPLGPAAAHAAEKLAGIARLQARATEDPLYRAAAAVAFQDLLLWSAARARGDHDSSDGLERLADEVATIIEARFARPLNADRLAAEVGHPQHVVARAFRRRFGVTVPRYALMRRMAHARLLLETTDLPIGEIGARVGVEDAHYFNKLVRRFLGSSPSMLRRQASLTSPP